jgi:hypothetical protein
MRAGKYQPSSPRPIAELFLPTSKGGPTAKLVCNVCGFEQLLQPGSILADFDRFTVHGRITGEDKHRRYIEGEGYRPRRHHDDEPVLASREEVEQVRRLAQ